MIKNVLVTAGILVALVVGAIFPVGGTTVVERVTEQLGGNAGTDHSFMEFFNGGITYGGGCFATSTTGVLTGKMLENGCVFITPTGAGQAAISLTMPASTTMDMIKQKGSCHDWFIDNTQVAAATTTTLVAGTGHDVMGLDATGAGTGADVIDGLEMMRLTSCRENNGNVVTFVHEYIHAD